MRRIHLFVALFWTALTLTGCEFWQTETQRWTMDSEGTPAIALSRHGQFALSYSDTHQLRLWDLTQSKLLAELGPQDPQRSQLIQLRFADTPRFALSASQHQFAVWDLAFGQATGLWSVPDAVIINAAIGDNGQDILLGLTNGKAMFIDLGSGRRLEFLAHQEKVNAVALSPNGKYALSGGNDKNAYLWDTHTGQALFHFPHRARVRQVALQRDGKLAFTADGEGHGFIWDLSNGEQLAKLDTSRHQLHFSAARFSDDGRYLITGTPGRAVAIWDTETGKRQQQFQVATTNHTRPPRAVVYDVALDPNQQGMAATSAGLVQAFKTELP